jgi:hypothetical protein
VKLKLCRIHLNSSALYRLNKKYVIYYRLDIMNKLIFLGLLVVYILILHFTVCFFSTTPMNCLTFEGYSKIPFEELRNIIISFVAIVGLPFVIWRAISASKQAEAASKQAKAALEHADIAQKEHIDERFTRSVTLLESKQTSVPAGGIHVLQLLIEANPSYRGTVVKILEGFVQDKASLHSVATKREHEEKNPFPPADIQAALYTLGTLNCHLNRKIEWINLSYTDLRGANLGKIDFRKANLKGANLEKANLEGADLSEAELEDTNLRGANLKSANLTGATLKETILADSVLEKCNFTDAKLKKVNSKGAYGKEEIKGITKEQLDSASI